MLQFSEQLLYQTLKYLSASNSLDMDTPGARSRLNMGLTGLYWGVSEVATSTRRGTLPLLVKVTSVKWLSSQVDTSSMLFLQQRNTQAIAIKNSVRLIDFTLFVLMVNRN